ncbi:type IV toxin-antitoxin system AbiEi family antitoxin domain-containing protein [Nocardioides xinjiangensis]|uniref:type IV toxin-antitoxin system AbiEi family antitoxin domain-containing protein n=1 Tax=Nocardioides xinjiangensis TaxID=2817376 RepID=UPI001B30C8C7|nr:type IV toxin-antitoxin system AbiEi family antitoxin domain-containing protein [Nocardioides sp. SYSU D00514]
MDLLSHRTARTQHGLLTHQQAVATGLSPRDIARLVRAGAWARIRKGVYADAEAYAAADPHREAPMIRMRAVVLSLARTPVFSHDSAAIVLGLGVPDAARAAVHVAQPEHRASRKAGGVVTHGAPFRDDEVRVVDGLRVVGAARTALDMARFHGLWPGVAACDAALRSGVTRADLEAAAAVMRGWPYKARVDRAVGLADAGSESYLESLARGLVVDLGIGTPQTQFGLTDGHRVAWCDIRVDRHVFEADGLLKYAADPDRALREEKNRQDFVCGFKLGVSRITLHDCLAGRRAALRRLAREYADTCARFGTSIDDLAPYVLPSSARLARRSG